MGLEDIEALENATPGERTVFRFLREAARPDSDFIGWYEPAIGEQGREPDLVLFGNQHGLLILEVKDRLIDQIEESVRSYLYGRGGKLMIDFATDLKSLYNVIAVK